MPRILVVEDDEAQRFLIDVMLRRARYDTVGVGNGNEALRLLAHDNHFVAILTDLQMPGMDGADLLSELAVQHPQLPVVVMTVHAGSDWVDDALRHGAVACLAKPFFGPELIETLDCILGKQTQLL